MNRNKILVLIDLNQDSIPLLRYSKSIAKSMHARLTFLSVMSDSSVEYLQDDMLINQRRWVELQLAETVTSNLKDDRLSYEIIVTKGNLYQRLASIADEFNFNMIILNENIVFNIKSLSKLVSIPLILYSSNNYVKCSNILFPLNLANIDLSLVDQVIDLASTLNTNVSLLSYSTRSFFDNNLNYNARLENIKSLFEKENISIIKWFYYDVELIIKKI